MGCEEHVGNSLLLALTWRNGLWAKGSRWLLRSWKKQGNGASLESPERNSALLALILAKRDLFWTCNLQVMPKQNKIKLKYTFAELYPQSVWSRAGPRMCMSHTFPGEDEAQREGSPWRAVAASYLANCSIREERAATPLWGFRAVLC